MREIIAEEGFKRQMTQINKEYLYKNRLKKPVITRAEISGYFRLPTQGGLAHHTAIDSP